MQIALSAFDLRLSKASMLVRKELVQKMGMNNTVSAERTHIGFFGIRNSGKSSLVNAVTGQTLSLVSDVKGTTTDPVRKTMELLPLGPVVIIDTPGIDDEGALGAMRVKKTFEVLNSVDIAVLVVDATVGFRDFDRELIRKFHEKNIKYIIAWNKSDLVDKNILRKRSSEMENNKNIISEINHSDDKISHEQSGGSTFSCLQNYIFVSARQKENIFELKEMLAHLMNDNKNDKRIVGDFIQPEDVVVLVVPIDSAAPKDRLILPQQQTIRDILESGAISVVTRETELKQTLTSLGRKPKLVITDSQAFDVVSKDTPSDILLTSFSILFMRYKGNLGTAVHGANTLDNLKDGDTILISEGCTHHRQCEDIGTVKLPAWIKNYTGRDLNFEFTSGREFPDDLSRYSLVIHCGGCMLNEREVKYRIHHSAHCNVPFTNYGVTIAKMNGILERSLEIFKTMPL